MTELSYRKVFTILAAIFLIWGANPFTRSCYSSGGRTNAASPAPLPVATPAPAYFVAPNGVDKGNNAGTIRAPFQTWAKAQSMMETTSIKTTYLRAGTYKLSKAITLTSADNGETWSYYPPDGYNTAILDFSQQVFSYPSNNFAVIIQGGSNITINGLDIRNMAGGGIVIHGGPAYYDVTYKGSYNFEATGRAYHNTIINNLLHDSRIGPQGSPGGMPWVTWCAFISAWGDVQNTTISNNAVYDAAWLVGIIVGVLQEGPGGGINNAVISNNFVSHVLSGTTADNTDAGAIYLNDRWPAKSTNIKVTNNFVRDAGYSGLAKGLGDFCFYFDDGASNITLSQNICAGTWTAAVFYHAGQNNTTAGNIFDLGTSDSLPQYPSLQQAEQLPMTGNSFTANIVISSSRNGGGKFGGFRFRTNSHANIDHNMYWNYAGGAVNYGGTDISNAGGSGGDPHPVVADPLLSGWTYTLAPNSPAFRSPVNFMAIPGKWGPPGFVVPHTGTKPSCPH